MFTVFYLYQLVQTRKYVGTYKVYKEGFNSAVLPEYVKEKMIGVSYRENPDISLDELRYVRIIHYDFKGQIQEGELVVNQKIAYPVMRAFYQLYKWEYPIERVRLVDDFDGDDEASMEENNTSAFNYRTVEVRFLPTPPAGKYCCRCWTSTSVLCSLILPFPLSQMQPSAAASSRYSGYR